MTVRIPRLSHFTPPRQRWLGSAAIGLAGMAGYVAYPAVLAKATSQHPVVTELSNVSPKQRQQYFQAMVKQRWLPTPGHQLNWAVMPDILDAIAVHSPSDTTFREDVWALFGVQPNGQPSELLQRFDATNQDLPKPFHNSYYQAEQLHHYLGGVTGNRSWWPSHLQNNRLYALLYELKELFATGQYNWGDVRLFQASIAHRNGFLRNGRAAVGPQLRQLLGQQAQPAGIGNYTARLAENQTMFRTFSQFA